MSNERKKKKKQARQKRPRKDIEHEAMRKPKNQDMDYTLHEGKTDREKIYTIKPKSLPQVPQYSKDRDLFREKREEEM